MKKYLQIMLYHLILVTLIFTIAKADKTYFANQNYKYYSDQDGRLYSKYYSYSNTEFEHAVDDERCVGRPDIVVSVKTTIYGNIRGKQISLCDTPGLDFRQRPGQPTAYGPKGSVRVYLGIPYAEPPVRRRNVENLQFQPPRYGFRFSDIDASRYRPACPQNEKHLSKGKGINTTDEDCLYLNIFAPGVMQYNLPTQEKYPVMIYIHGGNFDHGSGALFPGHMLAASQKVVVVTFNYRLGHLGFLATADQNSPGNYGMLDQVAALKWVHENIAVFDGDPDKITLFGTGAGAVSASLLALSHLSRNMVKRVIAQNGSPLADWAVITDPKFMYNTSQILGEGLGCSNEDSARLVECVGTRSNSEIKILKIKPRIGWLPFGPVLDNFTRPSREQFLQESPKDMLERGFLFDKSFSYMTGLNRDEGASIFLEDYVTPMDLQITEEKFSKKIKDFMKMYNYSINAEGIFDAIYFMYKPPVDSKNETLLRESYVHMLTDRYYVSPIDSTVRLMVQNKVPTYAYVLNYTLQGHSTILKDFVSSEREHLLLTGAPFMDPKFYPPILHLENAKWTEEDRNMSLFMMQAWANFAKEGNPTPTRLFNTIFWEPIKENNFHYLNLNATNTTSTMIPNYRERESRFWSTFLPFFIDRESPTLPPTLEPGVMELRVVTSALWGSVAVAVLLMLIMLVCCVLYCRIRSWGLKRRVTI